MRFGKSRALFRKSLKVMPGGVNSPVRAFKAVGGSPIFISSARGSRLFDEDGNSYIDYVLSWGPMILGHAHPRVVKALKAAVEKGTSYGAPTALELELAKLVLKAFPSMDRVRMVNSGTEAAMGAIRAARAFTGRDTVLKFEGGYHGHSDGLLVKAGSGAMTFGVPDSPGVPASYARQTLSIPFNDLGTLKSVIDRNWKKLACVIVEPVMGNIGCVLPRPGFLEGLRRVTKKYGIVLIFDEVMTGFRVSFGGAQERFNIKPDMTCLGKIIGGGLPVGAYGGKNEIMGMIAPEGPVYQAGTLSGNPLAMTAGIETLKILSDRENYRRLEELGAELEKGLAASARRAREDVRFYRAGSMFCGYFSAGEIYDYRSAKKLSDTGKFGRFFRHMLGSGINLAPSQFEAGFLSLAHTHGDIARTAKAAYRAMTAIK